MIFFGLRVTLFAVALLVKNHHARTPTGKRHKNDRAPILRARRLLARLRRATDNKAFPSFLSNFPCFYYKAT